MVAPFARINEPTSGLVSYEIHYGSTSRDILSYVSSIINEHDNISFDATWLLVATWENVTLSGGNNVRLHHVYFWRVK